MPFPDHAAMLVLCAPLPGMLAVLGKLHAWWAQQLASDLLHLSKLCDNRFGDRCSLNLTEEKLDLLLRPIVFRTVVLFTKQFLLISTTEGPFSLGSVCICDPSKHGCYIKGKHIQPSKLQMYVFVCKSVCV